MTAPVYERGMALVSSLLLLLVMTMLGVAMFRTFGTQEQIAGNTRDKLRATNTADSAEAYAEWWLSTAGGVNATAGTACNNLIVVTPSTSQVCSNQLNTVVPAGDVSVVPWQAAGTDVGLAYTPPGVVVGAGLADSYYQVPRYYISFVSSVYNGTTGAQTNSYVIDAAGWGGTSTAVSVVESSYVVNKLYTTQGSKSKYINLGAP